LLADAIVPKDGSTDQQILDWFSLLNFWISQQDVFEKRCDGTGIWFLEDPKFKSWLAGTARILWCTGIRLNPYLD
jgi:hypothetical protein